MVLREQALLCLVFICLCLVPVSVLDITCPSWSLSLSTVLHRPLRWRCIPLQSSPVQLITASSATQVPASWDWFWLWTSLLTSFLATGSFPLSETTHNPHALGQLSFFPAHLTATTTTSFLAIEQRKAAGHQRSQGANKSQAPLDPWVSVLTMVFPAVNLRRWNKYIYIKFSLCCSPPLALSQALSSTLPPFLSPSIALPVSSSLSSLFLSLPLFLLPSLPTLSSPLPLSLIPSPSSSFNSPPTWPLIRGERRRTGSGWCWFSESFCSELDQSSGLKRWWITTLITSSSSATRTLGEVIRYEWCSPVFPIPPLPSAPLLFWIRHGPTNCCGQKTCQEQHLSLLGGSTSELLDNFPFFLLQQSKKHVPLVREIHKIKAAWNVEPATEYSSPWASPRLKQTLCEHKILFWTHWLPVTGA